MERRRGDRAVTPSPFSPGFLERTTSRIAALLFLLLLSGSICSAGTATISVSATIPSGGFCWFTTNNATLTFGTLDPANAVDAHASTTVNFRCLGFPSVTYYVDDDDGLYETGPDANRMRHASLPQYLPYSMDVSPRTATISWSPFSLRTLAVSGTVRGADYQGAFPGNYADAVVLTIVP